MKRSKMIFRGSSVKLLEYFCKRTKRILKKKDKKIFIPVGKNKYCLNNEIANLIFHLTRIFVVFRNEEEFFPRKDGATFKSFTICGTFEPEEFKDIKRGIKFIANSTQKILRGIPA